MKDLVARALTEIAAPWTVNIASCLILGFAIGHSAGVRSLRCSPVCCRWL